MAKKENLKEIRIIVTLNVQCGFDGYKYWDAVENSRKKVTSAEIDPFPHETYKKNNY